MLQNVPVELSGHTVLVTKPPTMKTHEDKNGPALVRTPSAASGHEALNRWPQIARFLRVDEATGQIDHHFHWWCSAEGRLSPSERTAGNEEWAEFFEWRLDQRSGELAGDRLRRHLVTEWTESMAYICRRCAAWARGEDPGEWVPQRERRPDIYTEGKAIVADIIARMDAHPEPAELREAG